MYVNVLKYKLINIKQTKVHKCSNLFKRFLPTKSVTGQVLKKIIVKQARLQLSLTHTTFKVMAKKRSIKQKKKCANYKIDIS